MMQRHIFKWQGKELAEGFNRFNEFIEGWKKKNKTCKILEINDIKKMYINNKLESICDLMVTIDYVDLK
jgi:uncharacterized protein Usg